MKFNLTVYTVLSFANSGNFILGDLFFKILIAGTTLRISNSIALGRPQEFAFLTDLELPLSH